VPCIGEGLIRKGASAGRAVVKKKRGEEDGEKHYYVDLKKKKSEWNDATANL